MLKVKMLARHTGESGEKLERGLIYLLPRSYAEELVKHGLAVLVRPPVTMKPPVNVNLGPSKTIALETALRTLRAKTQEIIDRPKKRR